MQYDSFQIIYYARLQLTNCLQHSQSKDTEKKNTNQAPMFGKESHIGNHFLTTIHISLYAIRWFVVKCQINLTLRLKLAEESLTTVQEGWLSMHLFLFIIITLKNYLAPMVQHSFWLVFNAAFKKSWKLIVNAAVARDLPIRHLSPSYLCRFLVGPWKTYQHKYTSKDTTSIYFVTKLKRNLTTMWYNQLVLYLCHRVENDPWVY